MNPEDDPEARIRQLEQPLAYRYGSPYPAQPSSGMRWFWILAAVGVVGVLVLVGGIAAYAARQFAHGDLVVTSPTESTSVTTAPGTAPSPGKTHTPGVGPAPSAAPPAGQPVTVSGIDENRTVACTGNTITVSGISNNVVLTGHCGTVNVSGLNNIVTVDAVDAINASGLNNKVTYHSGAPKISKNGNGNVVEPG